MGGWARHVIPSGSEGSHCPSVPKHGQRCLGNARSCLCCILLFRRAARHDRGEWVCSPSLRQVSFRPSVASGEISRATLQIHLLPHYASPSYGEVSARESVQTERSKKERTPPQSAINCRQLPIATGSHNGRISPRLSVAAATRCLGNARSCLCCTLLFWRAARHDIEEGLRLAPALN